MPTKFIDFRIRKLKIKIQTKWEALNSQIEYMNRYLHSLEGLRGFYLRCSINVYLHKKTEYDCLKTSVLSFPLLVWLPVSVAVTELQPRWLELLVLVVVLVLMIFDGWWSRRNRCTAEKERQAWSVCSREPLEVRQQRRRIGLKGPPISETSGEAGSSSGRGWHTEVQEISSTPTSPRSRVWDLYEVLVWHEGEMLVVVVGVLVVKLIMVRVMLIFRPSKGCNRHHLGEWWCVIP